MYVAIALIGCGQKPAREHIGARDPEPTPAELGQAAYRPPLCRIREQRANGL
jgi:hypothetical protein